MWAGLSVLMAGAVTVSAVTLYKNIQQGKELEKFNTSLKTIENNNLQSVQGLTDKFNAQSEGQKKANKKNNPKLISAENEVADAEKHLANVKKAMKYIDALNMICQGISKCNAQAHLVNVDKDVFKGLVGADAVAGGANAGFRNGGEIADRMIKDAPNITGKMDIVQEQAGNLWERLSWADQAANWPHDAGSHLEKIDNLIAEVKMAFQNRLDDAEKAVADANAKVAEIKAALD